MGERGERLIRAVGLGAVVALAFVAGTGVMVTRRYRPDGGGPDALALASVGWSRHLVDWHRLSLGAGIAALVLWCGLTVAGRGWRSRGAVIALAATIGATAALAVSAVAWHRVRWSTLGLWAVTIGSDFSGLWTAAFSDKVRFVYVEGYGDLSQAQVAPWVVAYVVAPFVALGCLAVGWRMTGRHARLVARSSPSTGDPGQLETAQVDDLGRASDP